MSEIKNFKDLNAWQESRKLVLLIYGITKIFPPEEKFGLVSQMRRAIISISSNIAEGFSRGTIKDKVQFYLISKGSNTELENQLIVSLDLKYIDADTFKLAEKQIDTVSRVLAGLIKSAMPRQVY